MVIDSIALNCINGKSDKVYKIAIVDVGDQYVVNFEFGRRGSTLQAGTKTTSPVSLTKANEIFNKLIQEKTAKGYRSPQSFGLAPDTGAITKFIPVNRELSGIAPQLLKRIQKEDLASFINNDAYVVQQKHDGRRLLLVKDEQGIKGINKKGEYVSPPAEFAKEIEAYSGHVTFDGEAVGPFYFVFDLLFENGIDLRSLPYTDRLARLESRYQNSKTFWLVKTIREDKRDFVIEVMMAGKEGVVFKRADAPYSEQQIKYKFVESATVRVRHHNTQRK